LHKAALRLSGCIVGDALGSGSIIGLMPLMMYLAFCRILRGDRAVQAIMDNEPFAAALTAGAAGGSMRLSWRKCGVWYRLR
jgi:hypothetical protein